ncbi:hypothetical protein GCM10010254_22850 [Streptomyces chromofuscus]|nr:hypothetical protein GCM10010254_22850 [Streptomyces chromofuscus]
MGSRKGGRGPLVCHAAGYAPADHVTATPPPPTGRRDAAARPTGPRDRRPGARFMLSPPERLRDETCVANLDLSAR